MDNIRLNKGLLLLGFLITLISLLLSVLFNWIDVSTFNKIEAIISYRWMMLILLIAILILLFLLAYNKIFDSTLFNNSQNSPAKMCPSCGKPALKVISSTIRSYTYKCSNCGFDHKELKEGQTNTSRI